MSQGTQEAAHIAADSLSQEDVSSPAMVTGPPTLVDSLID